MFMSKWKKDRSEFLKSQLSDTNVNRIFIVQITSIFISKISLLFYEICTVKNPMNPLYY